MSRDSMWCSFSVPTTVYFHHEFSIFSSMHWFCASSSPPPASLIFSGIFFSLSISPHLPSQQASSINKKGLASLQYYGYGQEPARISGHYVFTYTTIPKAVRLYRTPAYFYNCLRPICLTPSSEHHSASLSGVLFSLRVPVCCLFSIYHVSRWVLRQTALRSAKVAKSSVGEIVSRQAHANLLPLRTAIHTRP